MATILFRTLPGIAAIEAQMPLYLEGRLMMDERVALERAITEASVRLFGIRDYETAFHMVPEEVRPATEEEWERHFEFLEWEFDEEETFWDAVGLDVTDEQGEELYCLEVFGRQLVCAVKRIHPQASAAFLTGEKSEAQIEAEAQAWIRNLMARGTD